MSGKYLVILMVIIIIALYYFSSKFRKNEIAREKLEIEEFEAELKKKTPQS